MQQAHQKFIQAEEIQNKYGDVIHHLIPYTDGAVTDNFTAIFIAPHPLEVIKVKVAYTQASTSGTLQIERLVDGVAPESGDNMLASTIDLASTTNTTISVTGTGLNNNRQLMENDRLALVDGGNIANLQNLLVSIYYKPLGRGDYR